MVRIVFRVWFLLLALTLLPQAMAANVALVLSDNGGPYAEFATSFEEFNAGLLTLQETLGAETFTPQLADYLFRMRGMGDAQDA